MSNINQVNPKILTTNQFNSATLTSKMQEFIQVENQVRSEINSIQQKKDRFREWTKSLGESPKIQEMFTKFDVRIQALFQKLDQFAHQREELAAGFLSDTLYMPVVGDTIIKESTGNSQKVEEVIKQSLKTAPDTEQKKVSETISEEDSISLAANESVLLPNEIEPEIQVEAPDSEPKEAAGAIAVTISEIHLEKTTEIEKVTSDVTEVIDKPASLETPVTDELKQLSEESFVEPAAAVVDEDEEGPEVPAALEREAFVETALTGPVDVDKESSEIEVDKLVELPAESLIESSDLKSEEVVSSVSEMNVTDDWSEMDAFEIQPSPEDLAVESHKVTLTPDEQPEEKVEEQVEVNDKATEIPMSAEVPDEIKAESIGQEISVMEPPQKIENLVHIEQEGIDPKTDVPIDESIGTGPTPDSPEFFATSENELPEAINEVSETAEEPAKDEAPTPVVEISAQIMAAPETAALAEEPAALIFEIAETESAATVISQEAEEPAAQQLAETNIEAVAPADRLPLEPVEIIAPETGLSSIPDEPVRDEVTEQGESIDARSEVDSKQSDTSGENQSPGSIEIATTSAIESVEIEKPFVKSELEIDSPAETDETEFAAFDDKVEEAAATTGKTIIDEESDTESLSFEINENILAEAIRGKHADYEDEPMDEDWDSVSVAPAENEDKPEPGGTVTIDVVAETGISVDMLELAPSRNSDDEEVASASNYEREGTEFVEIELPPASDAEDEEKLPEETPADDSEQIPLAKAVDLIGVTDNEEEPSIQPKANDESNEYFFGSKDIRRPRPIDLTNEEKEYKDRMPKLPREIFEKKFPRGSVDVSSKPEIKQSGSEAAIEKDKEVSEETRFEKLFNVKKIKSRFSLRKLMKTKEEEDAMEMERDVNQPETPVTDYESNDRKTVEEKPQASQPVHVDDKTVLYLGIDLGTSETTVAASNGIVETILSVIGKPKDVISQKLLKKDILFGMEALRNRLALTIYRPLEKGVIKETDADLEAARELVKYVIGLADPEKYDKVYAVIGAPARSSFANQQALMDAAREVVDAVMIVSEPFAVAYGEGKIYNSLIIDIGAGTTDICSLKGSMPNDEDQFTLLKAGDYIDNHLMEAIKNRIQGAQITKEQCKKWKEEYSFVIEPEKSAVASINIEGKPAKVDITKDIQASCESIMPDIVTCINSIVANFDPEFQEELKQSIILAGGGSLIKNIDQYLERALRSLGKVKVSRVENPIEAGARGALSLAKDLTDDYWRAL